MNKRIQFLSHKGKQILLVDFSNSAANEVETIAREVPDYVTVKPRGSVLVLADFTGASLNSEAIRVLQQSAVFDKPYVKKSAWVGVASLPDNFSREMKTFSGREYTIFGSRKEALSWLTED
jgi:hypothetical protein